MQRNDSAQTFGMCCRFFVDTETIEAYLRGMSDAEKATVVRRGDFYPTDRAPAVTENGVRALAWGFERGKKRILNARAETAQMRPMFTQAFRTSRCLIPATGFYEWDADRQKHYFVREDGSPMFLCGLADTADRLVVLTKQATGSVGHVHDRIPVLADENSADDYLRDHRFAGAFVLRDCAFPLAEAAPPFGKRL